MSDIFAAVDKPTRTGGYLLWMPDGTLDGYLWASKRRPDIASAQRLFARPQRWSTLERQGWRVEAVTGDVLRARTAERFAPVDGAS